MTPWTQKEVDDFDTWHEGRMEELDYPDKLREELRRARITFLSKVKRVKS